MTEVEWRAATDPTPMLAHLAARVSNRKLRLFSCACARRAWHFVKNKRLGECLHTLERFADGDAPDRDRGRVYALTGEIAQFNKNHSQDCVAWELWGASKKTLDPEREYGSLTAAAFVWADTSRRPGPVRASARSAQAVIVRDLFGNPFRPASPSRSWLTSTVVALAKGIYAEYAFDRMPILADALQDAGCDNDDVLNHCRGGRGDRGEPVGGSPHQPDGPHVRGCWVVDLLLGKK